MDMILTGRGVSGDEARLRARQPVVSPGQALAAAKELALQVEGFPQKCMRSDSLRAERGPGIRRSMANETRRGLEVIKLGETREGRPGSPPARAGTERSA